MRRRSWKWLSVVRENRFECHFESVSERVVSYGVHNYSILISFREFFASHIPQDSGNNSYRDVGLSFCRCICRVGNWRRFNHLTWCYHRFDHRCIQKVHSVHSEMHFACLYSIHMNEGICGHGTRFCFVIPRRWLGIRIPTNVICKKHRPSYIHRVKGQSRIDQRKRFRWIHGVWVLWTSKCIDTRNLITSLRQVWLKRNEEHRRIPGY